MRHGALLIAALLPALAGATTLAEAWQAAQQHDRALAVANAARGMADARRAQADALYQPSAQASATAGVGGMQSAMRGSAFEMPGSPLTGPVSLDTHIQDGRASRAALQAQWRLYNPARDAQAEQLRLAAQADQHQWDGARQQAALRLAQRHLDLALAHQRTQVLARQHAAVARAGDAARERYRVGSTPITDTHEAAAALAEVQAAQVEAAAQLRLAREALTDLTGLPDPQPALPALGVRAEPADPGDEAGWLAAARAASPDLARQRLAVDAARRGVRGQRPGAQLAVDAVGEWRHERLSGGGDFGPASQRATLWGVGVQISLPLFDGGVRSARAQQAASELAQAEAGLALAGEQLDAQVRAQWAGQGAQAARARAMQDALVASRARLDATRTGQQVGDRTLLDLLAAEADTARIELAHADAISKEWLAHLTLLTFANRLDGAALAALDDASTPPATP